MPSCLKCGAELPVNEEGIAPVLCDRCAGRANSRARLRLNAAPLMGSPATTLLIGINTAVFLGMRSVVAGEPINGAALSLRRARLLALPAQRSHKTGAIPSS